MDDDVKMSEISDVSTKNQGELSSTKIQDLLLKYGSDSRRTRTEDSLMSIKPPLRSIKESQLPDSATSFSTSFNSCSTSSSNSSVSVVSTPFTPAPTPFTPGPAPKLFSSRPPLSYSARITPRVRKANSLTGSKDSKIRFYEKGVQTNIMKKENDENTPPAGILADYNALKKQAIDRNKEIELLKKENDYLVAQVKKMQEQASLKAALSPDQQLEDMRNKILELEKENKYLTNQVKKMQEAASLKSVFPSKEHLSGAMGSFTIAGTEYDVWKKPIGKGASCLVYKAFDKTRDSMVAIKVVSLQKLNAKSNEEMRREIELLNNLKNEDCIINFYGHEFRKEHCRLSMVLEFGEMDLHTYLQQTPCLIKASTKESYHEVCLLWQQMLRAVNCIHSHSIVHKDLKPQNFMKVRGKLKLIDFGISQMMNDSEVTSMIIQQPEGTPNYIAPEMLSGTFGSADANVLGYRSDVYSLGCILFKMCFGVTPYQHIEKMQMKYYAITSDEQVKIPNTLDYPDIMETLRVSLQKDRSKRATVAQLLAM